MFPHPFLCCEAVSIDLSTAIWALSAIATLRCVTLSL